MSNEKGAFEVDADAYGFDLTRRECAAPEPWSEYADDATGHRWAGWSAALAWAATQQAPVAWSVKTADDLLIFQEERHAMHYSEKWGYPVTPLYTHPAPAECAAMEWRPIETAPKDGRTMFVVKAFDVRNGFTGGSTYTSDPWCVWRDDGGSFARWPHNFQPTHWALLPAAPKPQGGA